MGSLRRIGFCIEGTLKTSESTDAGVWLGERQSRHVMLDVGGAGKALLDPEPLPARAVDMDPILPSGGHTPSDGDVHPLLLLYPFDPPAQAVPKVVDVDHSPPTLGVETLFSGDFPNDPPVQESGWVVEGELSDQEIDEHKRPETGASGQFRQRRRKRHAARGTRRDSGEFGELWARYGLLFSLILIANAASSYQLAKLYRNAAQVQTAEWAMSPAVFLVVLIPIVGIVHLLKDQSDEIFAVSMVWLLACITLVGLGCKVLSILLAQA